MAVGEVVAADVGAAGAERGSFAAGDRTDQLSRVAPRTELVGPTGRQVHERVRAGVSRPYLAGVALVGEELAMAGEVRAGRGLQEAVVIVGDGAIVRRIAGASAASEHHRAGHLKVGAYLRTAGSSARGGGGVSSLPLGFVGAGPGGDDLGV